ncbi:MAG: haloacid dehalogenase-like hydrolase, partial [Gammaproteobacteria bacterium]|nr:haloacid dehalogenase-like hydrolase [Gammaproteobacteria bacterium]
MIDWHSIDTVLLDMDGTLLDLKYDNTLWNQLVPDRYCDARPSATQRTRQDLLQHMMDTRHTIDFYCLNYWARYTGLEIVALHHELAHLIQYRPGAESFLGWLDREGVRRILVTNAHRDSLSVKNAYSGLCRAMHATVSSHDYGHPKETESFWVRLPGHHPLAPSRRLLLDRSPAGAPAAPPYGLQ